MLLTRLLLSPEPPQIVALSATVGALNHFDEWLRCQVIHSNKRPVPLEEYAVTAEGRVLRYDDQARNLVEIERLDVGGSLDELVPHLVENGDQVLVFRAHVGDTESAAQMLARHLPSVEVPLDLATAVSELDDSESRAVLEQLIRHGVAYHNAGLSLEERLLVEEAFRSGHVKVLVSTTTLAMGVNLPADSVVIADYQRWHANIGARTIDVAEYKNCAGRAGRLSHRQRGRSYILVDRQAFADGIANHFLRGTPEVIESAIPRSRLIEHVLGAISSRLAPTKDEVHRIFQGCFANATFWSISETDELSPSLEESLTELSQANLIRAEPSGAISATAVGEVVGRSGISVASASRIISYLDQLGSSLDEADVIFTLCHCEEIVHQYPFLRNYEKLTNTWKDHVRENCNTTPGSTLHSVLENRMVPSDSDNSALKRCGLALEWKQAGTERTLTTRYRLGLGYVRSLAENLAWLLETGARLAKAMDLSDSVVNQFHELSNEMHFGVPYAAVQFARLRVRGLRRAEVTRLVDNETGRVFNTINQVLDASPTDFQGIINPAHALQLQQAILRSASEGLRRHEAGLLVRARMLAIPEALIKNLFSSQGIDFERAVKNLLNAEPLGLGAVRLTRQREGEVDLYIPLSDGGSIVIGATSSTDNARPISWDKVREIFGAVGAPAPIRNFVVLGKPEFHEVARRNADDIVRDENRSLLLLPVGIFGELCLEVFEQHRNVQSLLDLLTTQRGYLKSLDRATAP